MDKSCRIYNDYQLASVIYPVTVNVENKTVKAVEEYRGYNGKKRQDCQHKIKAKALQPVPYPKI